MLEERKNRSVKHISQVNQSLEVFRVKMLPGDNAILEKWQQRSTQLWENIEAALKLESEIVTKRLADEQKIRDEQEQKRKEAEEKKRQAEERKKREEEAKQKEEEAKQKEEEEKRKAEEEKKREEALEQEQWAKAEEERTKRLDEEKELRKIMSFSPAREDWKIARTNLYQLKSGPVKHIKDTQNRVRGEFRRKITPKIGQLTNDIQSVRKIVSSFCSSQISYLTAYFSRTNSSKS
jgi:nucleoporin GLE1